jgi:hypothetical protein
VLLAHDSLPWRHAPVNSLPAHASASDSTTTRTSALLASSPGTQSSMFRVVGPGPARSAAALPTADAAPHVRGRAAAAGPIGRAADVPCPPHLRPKSRTRVGAHRCRTGQAATADDRESRGELHGARQHRSSSPTAGANRAAAPSRRWSGCHRSASGCGMELRVRSRSFFPASVAAASAAHLSLSMPAEAERWCIARSTSRCRSYREALLARLRSECPLSSVLHALDGLLLAAAPPTTVQELCRADGAAAAVAAGRAVSC